MNRNKQGLKRTLLNGTYKFSIKISLSSKGQNKSMPLVSPVVKHWMEREIAHRQLDRNLILLWSLVICLFFKFQNSTKSDSLLFEPAEVPRPAADGAVSGIRHVLGRPEKNQVKQTAIYAIYWKCLNIFFLLTIC